MTTTYRPALGLKKLTWSQVEELDRVIAEACEATNGQRSAFRIVPVVIMNGQPRKFGPAVELKDLKPNRSD